MTYEEFKEAYDIERNVIKSDSWSLGGSHCNCWGNTYSVEPEPPLTVFSEFIQLLSKIDENIPYLKYLTIHDECVSCRNTSENDYYGGTVYYAYFECDVQNLYHSLLKHNIID